MRVKSARTKLKLLSATLFLAMLSGCAGVAPTYQATNDNVRALMALNGKSVAVGTFVSADPSLDSLAIRATKFSAPNGKGFAEYMKQALVAELISGQHYAESSPTVVTATLVENVIDTMSSQGHVHVAVRYVVTRDGVQQYDKVVRGDATFESSFIGAVAIPLAWQNYAEATKKMLNNLFSDPDFQKAI